MVEALMKISGALFVGGVGLGIIIISIIVGGVMIQSLIDKFKEEKENENT